MPLTDLAVETVKKRCSIRGSGCRGLMDRVSPSGLKAWVFRYYHEGRDRRVTLGQFPGIGLGEARKRGRRSPWAASTRHRPGQLAKEKKAKLKAAPTVSQLLDEFYEVELSKTPSGDERKRLLKKDIIPTWGKRKVKDIPVGMPSF